MKTRIHIGRIIVYIILFIVAVSMYRFLQSHYTLIMLIIMTAAPVLSIGMCFLLRRSVSIDLKTASGVSKREDISYVTVTVINPTFFISMDAGIHLIIENTFYENRSDTMLSLPVRVHGNYSAMLPMKLSMNGNVKYIVDYIRVRDILGFIDMPKMVSFVTEQNVIPEDIETEGLSMTDMNRGMSESEESKKKGNDYSDVSDVREYIPGDRLMSIHWKLSAKRDILMVKDRESMSDQQVVLLISLAGTSREVDSVLTLGYNLIRKMVMENVFVKLVWWDEGAQSFNERQIGNINELLESFSDIYYSGTYKEGDRIKDYMASIMPHLRSYVMIEINESGDADAVIVEQG